MVVYARRRCVDVLEGESTYAARAMSVERMWSFADVPGDYPTTVGWPQVQEAVALPPSAR